VYFDISIATYAIIHKTKNKKGNKMAVELEKIAVVLDEAYGQISELESRNSELEEEKRKLEEQLMLAKQAEEEAVAWGNDTSFGHVANDMPSTYENAESRLDSFLSD
jgi:hypothetical protein